MFQRAARSPSAVEMLFPCKNPPVLSLLLSSSWEASHLCKLWKAIDKRKGMTFASGSFTQRYAPGSQRKIWAVGSTEDLWRMQEKDLHGVGALSTMLGKKEGQLGGWKESEWARPGERLQHTDSHLSCVVTRALSGCCVSYSPVANRTKARNHCKHLHWWFNEGVKQDVDR